MKKYLLSSLLSILSLNNAQAAPVEFDTPNAHIIVMRSLDAWSGDASESEKSLDVLTDKKGGFAIDYLGQSVSGVPDLFGIGKNPLVVQVNNSLSKYNFKLSQSGLYYNIQKPITIAPSDYEKFSQFQNKMYNSLAVNEGDPTKLHSSIAAKKFFGAILAIGTTALVSDKFGSSFGMATINSAVDGDIYQVASRNKAALVPLILPNFDPTNYKSIDVRKVIQGNNTRYGQIIIAYKNDKTDDVEFDSLVKAIITTLGADTTPAEVQKARDEDFTNRLAIWKASQDAQKTANN